jgi:NADPH-dependent 2,4-dienoyl-CoA reductase/sulfur reductase-like enzyme
LRSGQAALQRDDCTWPPRNQRIPEPRRPGAPGTLWLWWSGPTFGEAALARLASIVVVGASLAGLRCAEALRREGYDGRLTLIGAEQLLPYDRPPLSKEMLRGTREPDQISLVRPERFDPLEVELRLGTRATGLDQAGRAVLLGGGERIGFDGLVIATGATPRRLAGTPDLAGIHTLRTLDDSLAIRSQLDGSPRVVVVGAGFIGSEVAASCRELGLDVSVIEMLSEPLENALGPRLGATCAALHRDHGVDLRCGTGVDGFVGDERVEAVRLRDGSTLAADLVVVGIGVSPETGWLEDSGLEISDGVVCDETSAAAPDIVAAGDVARWYNPLFGESMRVEHWTNAVEQGEAAAIRLLAGPAAGMPFAPVPFVWSDQYDAKIQCAGRPKADDEIRVVHGSLEERRFVALFGRKGRLSGAVAFNRARLLMKYRRMMHDAASWEAALDAANS